MLHKHIIKHNVTWKSIQSIEFEYILWVHFIQSKSTEKCAQKITDIGFSNVRFANLTRTLCNFCQSNNCSVRMLISCCFEFVVTSSGCMCAFVCIWSSIWNDVHFLFVIYEFAVAWILFVRQMEFDYTMSNPNAM